MKAHIDSNGMIARVGMTTIGLYNDSEGTVMESDGQLVIKDSQGDLIIIESALNQGVLLTNEWQEKAQLRALSWKQPFGTAMLYGKVETRTWQTKYRGWVLICTSKKAYDKSIEQHICGTTLFVNMCKVMSIDTKTIDLNGYAIAVGRLVDSHPMRKEDEEKCFVKYRSDLFCHVYEDVQAIEPFPWKGCQGWREVPMEIKSQIRIINAE